MVASLAARDNHAVTLITALARDPAGRELAALLAEAGVEVVDLGLDGATPEKVRIRSGGHSLLRLDRGRAPGVVGQVTEAARSVLDSAAAVLVSDYGITGTSDEVGLAHAVARGAGCIRRVCGADHSRRTGHTRSDSR
jgi:D-beta-D-heptose 7-phosphate kinase/D-beta-D-heptose 1-phosphate adenosyltransferase